MPDWQIYLIAIPSALLLGFILKAIIRTERNRRKFVKFWMLFLKYLLGIPFLVSSILFLIFYTLPALGIGVGLINDIKDGVESLITNSDKLLNSAADVNPIGILEGVGVILFAVINIAVPIVLFGISMLIFQYFNKERINDILDNVEGS